MAWPFVPGPCRGARIFSAIRWLTPPANFDAALRASAHWGTNIEPTDFGTKYQVECQLETPDEMNPCILSVWIVEDDLPPRLITAHPNS